MDPSAAALIVEIRKNSYFKRRKIKVIPAKNNVMLGIQFLSHLLNIGKFTVGTTCKEDVEEFTSYVWDEDKLNKGVEEVVKLNDHCMDRNRYAVLTDTILYKTYKNVTDDIQSKLK